jgi:hypothetical protein
MAVVNKIKRWLMTKIVKREVSALRGSKKGTAMGKVLKYLDGWKLMIGVAILAGTKAWDMAHNGHSGDIAGVILTLLGWTPNAEWSGLAVQMAGPIMILIGTVSKLFKAQKQFRSGTSIAGLLSTEGYVTQYVADGKE